ncbi:MAG: 3-isopropylmalate/(R)-2-methylmalate dehydratase small subunit [Frankiaceae bacterium]|jgi:3-isopropylmalate/(R)-2-methylmalate dehydratase small subunit|nr:3-isopropylmalate/(R)-2-methylmalate dehydratase small subunit [Frankiaceae bacterium]
MQPFTVVTGRALPLRRSNVDTDQIIPAEYLKRVTRSGFEDGLFAAWRKDPDFVLNDPAYAGASILIAGPDFGTGSSREHAVWALQDYGFRAVIAPRFGDIFRGNATKGGLVPVEVGAEAGEQLMGIAESSPSAEITVDLIERVVRAGALVVPFDLDDYTRWRLMEGLDDIGLSLRHADEIASFEAVRPAWLPTTSRT